MSGMGMPGSLGKLSTALHEQLAIYIEKKRGKKKVTQKVRPLPNQRKQELFGTRGQGTRAPGTIDDRHPDGLRRRFSIFS